MSAVSEKRVKAIKGELMSRHTTLRIGGPCEIMLFPTTEEEVADCLRYSVSSGLPYFILGNGSNLVVSDNGFPGIVLNLREFSHIKHTGQFLWVETGTQNLACLNYCLKNGLTGLEFIVGIPGTIGGMLAMNAGEFFNRFHQCPGQVKYLDSEFRTRKSELGDVEFGYRYSELKGKIILSLIVELQLDYPEKIQERINAYQERRVSTQPMGIRTAGSTFKNPEGDYAGRLLEAAGLKGFQMRRVRFSPIHSNFVENMGDATSGELIALIAEAKRRVLAQFGIALTPEVEFLGEFGSELDFIRGDGS